MPFYKTADKINAMKTKHKITITKAKLQDAVAIREIISVYAKEDKMLPRSLSSIYDRIKDFYIAKVNNKVVGTCGIHFFWEDIAEIRSLAVDKKFLGSGIGSLLVKACIKDAKEMGVRKIFTLTLVPRYFSKFGFKKVDSRKLPMKIWGECKNCPKFMNCDEIPMLLEIK